MAFVINYNRIEEKYRNTIRNIESKPHVKYIRYLMSKKYSPWAIRTELSRLGLSSPHEPLLTVYYLCVMDPMIKKFGLSDMYSDYKNKQLNTSKNRTRSYTREIVNYRLDLGDMPDLEVKFCKFIRHIEIDELWLNEMYRYYGSADRFPVDENGQKILILQSPKKVTEKILSCPKRYLIDKMILENLADARISKYCRDTLKIPVQDYDVKFYKNYFFNIQAQSIEDKIKSLEFEINSMKTLISDVDNSESYADIDIGEKMLIKKQAEQRITELNDNIKTLNMMYSDIAFQKASQDNADFESIFTDVALRSYNRFVNLDQFKDRDVIDPLMKTARILTFAHDKVETIRATSKSGNGGDMNSQGVIMELYKQRLDDINKEHVDRVNKELVELGQDPLPDKFNPEDIEGIDELGVSFEVESEE